MISLYSDGSSSGGKGQNPGGYGWVIVRDGEVLAWGYGGAGTTTNNLMEMQGGIAGLEAVIHLGLHEVGEQVEWVSDSQYALGIASGAYHASANVADAERLQDLACRAGTRFRWVRGHNGNTWNEICDKLAKQGKEENTPEELLRQRETRQQRRQERRRKVKDAQQKDSA